MNLSLRANELAPLKPHDSSEADELLAAPWTLDPPELARANADAQLHSGPDRSRQAASQAAYRTADDTPAGRIAERRRNAERLHAERKRQLGPVC